MSLSRVKKLLSSHITFLNVIVIVEIQILIDLDNIAFTEEKRKKKKEFI